MQLVITETGYSFGMLCKILLVHISPLIKSNN